MSETLFSDVSALLNPPTPNDGALETLNWGPLSDGISVGYLSAQDPRERRQSAAFIRADEDAMLESLGRRLSSGYTFVLALRGEVTPNEGESYLAPSAVILHPGKRVQWLLSRGTLLLAITPVVKRKSIRP